VYDLLQFSQSDKSDVLRYATKQCDLILPRPEVALISRLFHCCASIFENEHTLLEINSPCVIVGDIHGQILDLFRILNSCGPAGRTTYVFLGDIVDRGEFSVESLICVLLLKALHPDHVFVIRGNHEFGGLCSHCGFLSQIMEFFQSSSLYQDALLVFGQMPLAARIDNSILCVHGGIGPSVANLTTISWVKRPIEEFGDDIIDSLVWSDPDPSVEKFEESSTRGAGYRFGETAAAVFLEENKLELLVRAHECIPEGAKEMFGGKVMTIFSASNYCGLMGNEAAVLLVAPGMRQIRRFPPLPWLVRGWAQFTSGVVVEPIEPKDGSGLGRRPKGLLRMGSEGTLLTIASPRPGGGKCALSGSMAALPKLVPEAPLSPLVAERQPMNFGAPVPVIKPIKPVARLRKRQSTIG
jgi:protein phosphatase